VTKDCKGAVRNRTGAPLRVGRSLLAMETSLPLNHGAFMGLPPSISAALAAQTSPSSYLPNFTKEHSEHPSNFAQLPAQPQTPGERVLRRVVYEIITSKPTRQGAAPPPGRIRRQIESVDAPSETATIYRRRIENDTACSSPASTSSWVSIDDGTSVSSAWTFADRASFSELGSASEREEEDAPGSASSPEGVMPSQSALPLFLRAVALHRCSAAASHAHGAHDPTRPLLVELRANRVGAPRTMPPMDFAVTTISEPFRPQPAPPNAPHLPRRRILWGDAPLGFRQPLAVSS